MKPNIKIAYTSTKGWHEVKEPKLRKSPNEGGSTKLFAGTEKQVIIPLFYKV